jgi:DNA-binding beta-propeller fold protein YncE
VIQSSFLSSRRVLAGIAVVAVAVAILGVPDALGGTKSCSGTVAAGTSAVATCPFKADSVGTISATISWSPVSAVLSVALVDPQGVLVPITTTGSNPTTVSGQATVTGPYKVRVKAKSGSASFTGSVTYPGASVPSYAGQIGGNNPPSYPGHATMYPSGLDVGPNGTIYVADTGNDQVAAYAPDGSQLWRIGSRGSRTVGNFDNPRDVTYLNGNLYVDDTGNNRVEVIDTTASPVTSASVTQWTTKFPSTLGITAGKDASGNNIILVTEDTSNQIAVFDPSGTSRCNITGPSGTLHAPRDAATNAAGDVYVADYNKDRIVEFGPVSGSNCSQSVIGGWGSSGNGSLQFKRPYGVAVDASGNVYVADSDNERIQEFTATGTYLHTFGDKTPALGGSGDLVQLRRVAVANGQVYGADLWGWHVDRFTTPGPTPAQTYPSPIRGPQAGYFNEPSGLTFDSAGNLYVADSVNQRIQPFSPGATGSTWTASIPWGTRGWGASDLSGFNWPRDITFASGSNSLWVADTKNNRLLQFSTSGTPILNSAINLKTITTPMPWPYGIDAVGNHLIVANTFANQVESLNTDGTLAWGPVTSANGIALKNPYDIADANGVIYIADAANKRIVELRASDGSYLGYFGTGTLHSPQGIAVDPTSGNLWVSDTSYNQLVEFDSQGTYIQTVKTFGGTNTFNHPSHLDVHTDAAGHAYLYVTDTYHDRIVIFDLNEN